MYIQPITKQLYYSWKILIPKEMSVYVHQKPYVRMCTAVLSSTGEWINESWYAVECRTARNVNDCFTQHMNASHRCNDEREYKPQIILCAVKEQEKSIYDEWGQIVISLRGKCWLGGGHEEASLLECWKWSVSWLGNSYKGVHKGKYILSTMLDMYKLCSTSIIPW